MVFNNTNFEAQHSFQVAFRRFQSTPNFRWADIIDKDEIGKGSFGSVMKANYVPEKKTVVVKRFFGEGDSNLKIVAKEAKMLKNLRHRKVAEFVAVCPKPVAIMMEYECFDFLPFGLDVQVQAVEASQSTVSQSTISQSTISQTTVSQSTVSQSTISQSTVSFRFVSFRFAKYRKPNLSP